MEGLQGSGKSTIADALSEASHLPIFSVDPIHSAILEAGIPDSFEVGLADYLVAEKLASENLAKKISVIIDASNYVRKSQELWEKLAKEHNATLRVIKCITGENIHRDRVKARFRNISGIKELEWKDVSERKKKAVDWNIDKLIIDTGKPITVSLKSIKEYLSI